MAAALEELEVHADVGELPGEYCPGEHSVHGTGRTVDRAQAQIKLAGAAQRDVAAVPVAACKKLGISADIVNVLGSGCSIGHPVAASGARMILSLINELRRRGGGYGVAAMCAGGGQAGAVVIDVPAPANR